MYMVSGTLASLEFRFYCFRFNVLGFQAVVFRVLGFRVASLPGIYLSFVASQEMENSMGACIFITWGYVRATTPISSPFVA